MENTVKPRKTWGLFLGTLTGWVGVLIIDIFSSVFLKVGSGMNFFGFKPEVLLSSYIFIGLPIALTLGLILGNIIWAVFEVKGLIKINHALLGGGIVGALLGGITFYLTLDSAYIIHNFADLTSTIAIGILAGFVTHRTGYGKATTHHLDPLEG